MKKFHMLKRLFSTQLSIKPKICIIGSGPAGFYAAQHLVKKLDPIQIDIYERLPVPFGLVRFGVAPDHPEVKNVINTFTKTAKHPNVRFFGNVNLGTDVTLEQLRHAYHITLLSYGADQSRKLDIPGENIENCIEARSIVGWYNGTPWDANLRIDLSGETALIFGQGNVAIDVARILLSPIDELRKTDITQHALDAISSSKIKTVYLIGRRGLLQAAFTIKELREMLKLPGCTTVWRKNDFDGISDYLPKLLRPKKRITELMLKSLQEGVVSGNGKEFRPVFFRSPLKILGEDKVKSVTLGQTKLEGDDFLKQNAVLTDARETLNCDLVIPSIGYKSIQADAALPFDEKHGIIKNLRSRVDKGIYVSGWLGTGPTGVILTTMSNAFEVASIIMEDIGKEHLLDEPKGGFEEIEKNSNIGNKQVVSWAGWEKIDEYEKAEGAKIGKPREKIVDIKKMLEVAAS